ncbi:MAG: DUF5060 domain-containing protein [Armatimonadetes bacterium]|nr:DUF5060 domain-containing protein [Armatimonadota bacterium]
MAVRMRLLLVLFATAACAAPLAVTCVANSPVIPRWDVFELSFQHERVYDDPFFDVTVDVTFHPPTGAAVRVGGFHYGSPKRPTVVQRPGQGGRRSTEYVYENHDLWKARLAPWEVGGWRYEWVFRNKQGEEARGEGRFECVTGRAPLPGFIRLSQADPFAWVFDDGTPFFPVGLQECVGDAGVGSAMAGASLEGPFRTDRTNLVELPQGPRYVRGPSMNPQNMDVYLRRYGRCGFNLFRFSQANCSYNLYADLDHWSTHEAVMTDELLQYCRKYGFRVMYGIFGYQKVFNEHPEDAAGMEKVKRFVQYSVNRWGAYVDIWEFLNEQQAVDGWYAQMTPYLKSIDPYHHPVTTSWERPNLEGIDVNAPHWYGNEDEHKSDTDTAGRARGWKAQNKPVIVGEQGNWVAGDKPRPVGVGGVWDAGSARRMRIRLWTSLFNEISLVFWNTSYARDGHNMNLWIGPQERSYVHALQDFSARLDALVKPAEVQVSEPAQVRAYGLASDRRAAVYLHHFADHDEPAQGVTVSLTVPAACHGYWYVPETAAIVGRFDAPAGAGQFVAPPFRVDLALLLTPDGSPDLDHDGKANDEDPDDDGDGVADVDDAFPCEPEEWADADHDLIGDNLDADGDGDGKGDDANHNGIADCEELDFDGDGVPRAKVVPWDAFPLDPKEWADTDGDGIGDNADPDIDGDGWSNAEEKAAGTDPANGLSFPRG